MKRLALVLVCLSLWLSAAPLLAQEAGGAAGEVESSPAPARGRRVPTIELYSMGPGDHLFSLFGHSALCVTDAVFPKGRCYNYGTTDFSRPVRLVWDFLHGDVKFWVAGDDLRSMVKLYQVFDRTIYRQRLNLSPEAAFQMAERLSKDALPENRSYLYHHFKDNCSTRLRDHIDVITGGALSVGADAEYGLSIRGMVQEWTRGNWGILVLSEFLIGRVSDKPATQWEAMFLPDVLREQVTLKLGVAPEILYTRKGPLPEGNTRAGLFIFLTLAVFLGLVSHWAARRRGFSRRAGLILVGAVLAFFGGLIDFLVIVSDVPELYLNELLVVFLPTDLVLWVGTSAFLRSYARYRLIALGLVAVLSLVGLLQQPMLGPIALVALPMLGLLLTPAPELTPEGEAALRAGEDEEVVETALA